MVRVMRLLPGPMKMQDIEGTGKAEMQHWLKNRREFVDRIIAINVLCVTGN